MNKYIILNVSKFRSPTQIHAKSRSSVVIPANDKPNFVTEALKNGCVIKEKIFSKLTIFEQKTKTKTRIYNVIFKRYLKTFTEIEMIRFEVYYAIDGTKLFS